MERSNSLTMFACFIAFLGVLLGLAYYVYAPGGVTLVQKGQSVRDDFAYAERMREFQHQAGR